MDKVLEEIGAHEVPQLIVYNKIDLLSGEAARAAGVLRDTQGRAVAVNVSVTQGLGLEDLRAAMIERAEEARS